MREILFRGKLKAENGEFQKGEWVYGDFVTLIDGKEKHPHIYGKGEVKAETIGQYTGLTDKNGKEIFEGDIFKFPDEIWESSYTSCGTEYDSWTVENYGVVGFCEDTGRFDFIKYKFNENSVEADLHENHNIEFCEFVSDLEIIGNIHDNPELLESEVQGE